MKVMLNKFFFNVRLNFIEMRLRRLNFKVQKLLTLGVNLQFSLCDKIACYYSDQAKIKKRLKALS